MSPLALTVAVVEQMAALAAEKGSEGQFQGNEKKGPKGQQAEACAKGPGTQSQFCEGLTKLLSS